MKNHSELMFCAVVYQWKPRNHTMIPLIIHSGNIKHLLALWQSLQEYRRAMGHCSLSRRAADLAEKTRRTENSGVWPCSLIEADLETRVGPLWVLTVGKRRGRRSLNQRKLRLRQAERKSEDTLGGGLSMSGGTETETHTAREGDGEPTSLQKTTHSCNSVCEADYCEPLTVPESKRSMRRGGSKVRSSNFYVLGRLPPRWELSAVPVRMKGYPRREPWLRKIKKKAEKIIVRFLALETGNYLAVSTVMNNVLGRQLRARDYEISSGFAILVS